MPVQPIDFRAKQVGRQHTSTWPYSRQYQYPLCRFNRQLHRQRYVHSKPLQSLFEQSSLKSFLKPMVTTCGSGVSAAVLALALYQLGLQDIAVYDGSWAEWEDRRIPLNTLKYRIKVQMIF